MNFLKNLFSVIGFLVVAAVIFAFVKFDLGTRIGQAAQLDPQALPEYMKMFDKVLETGDPAKGMIRKKQLIIPEGMTKQEAFANALEIMDEVANEHGLSMVDQKTMPREGKLFKDGGKLTHIRSYCSPTIADKFLTHSGEFIGFMPCRVGFVENDKGEIWIYTMSMELMINGGRPLSPDLLELANEVRTGMYAMLEKSAALEEL
ncbi:DUF302 domain-containing protein [Sulfurovum sp. zt1-1]|uniref:DUF302 domain-containing protein n=1 Tax=Sulfurovum zhangzhouensis TaxID=3019067 RepID=A0ABT7QZT8_9BACT|nr:DUF302 domain-containing protein [Sulfurovum zhangzhouensis]MDM5272344.1 DUF302 domain-containing protein [Sulfurovum zhangzhouensis]